MKFIKKNKKLFLGIVLGMIASSGVVYASGLLAASITYDNTTSGLKDSNNNNVTDVQTAIDVLYSKAQAASQSGSGSSSSSGFSSLNSTLSRTPIAFDNGYASYNSNYMADDTQECNDPSTCSAGIFGVKFDGDYYYDEYTYGGVCFIKNNEQYCFRNNNYVGEIEYFKSVAPDAVCELVDSGHESVAYSCYSFLRQFDCTFYPEGGLTCENWNPDIILYMDPDGSFSCDHG